MEAAKEKQETKQFVSCPVCKEVMESKPTKKVFGFRYNQLLLLINQDIELLYCPICNTTMLYDTSEPATILTQDRKIIV